MKWISIKDRVTTYYLGHVADLAVRISKKIRYFFFFLGVTAFFLLTL